MSGFEPREDPNKANNKEDEEDIEEPITLERYVDKVQNTKREIINQIISCA
jgi:hypothetical protein